MIQDKFWSNEEKFVQKVSQPKKIAISTNSSRGWRRGDYGRSNRSLKQAQTTNTHVHIFAVPGAICSFQDSGIVKKSF